MNNTILRSSKFGSEDSKLKDRIRKKLLWYETKNTYNAKDSPAKNYQPLI